MVNSFIEAARVHVRVIVAIMLRDMRTRYGRTYWGYLIAVGWPLSHLVSIVLGFIIINHAMPLLGTDSVTYISTGVLPYVLFIYPARMAALAVMAGRGMIAFPIVQPIDLMLARVLLETVNAFCVCIIFCLGLWITGVEMIPEDIPVAMTAVYATVFLGISVGVFGTLLVAVLRMPGYLILIMLMIVSYLGSGAHIPVMAGDPSRLFWYGINPLFHLVGWMRSAYFNSHQAVELSKSYVLMLSFGLLAAGLLGERIFRGKALM